jgi:hypothetical protein
MIVIIDHNQTNAEKDFTKLRIHAIDRYQWTGANDITEQD